MTTVFTRILPFLIAAAALAQQSPLDFPGGHGPRPREAGGADCRRPGIPLRRIDPRTLAQILAVRHGSRCTALFSVNRQTGKIDPNTIDNIPGLEALRRADLVVFFALVGTARKDLLESFRARETAMVDDLLFCRVFWPRRWAKTFWSSIMSFSVSTI